MNFAQKACRLAQLAHSAMMAQGMRGIYSPIIVCGVKVTCADDLQSVNNRFCQNLRGVACAEIDSAIAYFESQLETYHE